MNRRLQTVALSAVALLAIAYVALSSYAIVRAFNYDESIAEERMRNTVSSCLERGRQNDGIVAYLRDLGADADDIQQARAFFPKRTQDDCEQSAAETVTKP